MPLMQLLWPGALAVQAVHVAAKLGLADLIGDGSKTAEELAQATGAHAPSLARLLRALTSLEVFADDGGGRYRQTALSETLRTDHPQSVRRWALMLGAPFIWRPCGELSETIRTGQTAFETVHQAPFFAYLADHPEDAAIFNAAMSSVPAYIAAFVGAYDFSRFERIVDVGGGRGARLQAILAANPGLRGVLQDLPAVVQGVAASPRCESVGGDFFERVPEGADAYLLAGIIHDWNDEAAVKILKNCRKAIRQDGVLLLLETMLTPSSEPARALMDILMMVLTGGRERTEAEFRALLRGAGFELTRVIPTPTASILEAQPT
jgi:hypothetical protein